jgi:hypothetical protein
MEAVPSRPRRRGWVLFGAVALGLVAATINVAQSKTALATKGGTATATTQSGKLVVIVEENEPYGNIVGNPQAPYLNQLIANWELFTNYTAVAPSSTSDYLAMTSGLTSSLSPPSPNIFQAIDGTGGAVTWKEFMESMPGNCAQGTSTNIPGTSVPLYTASHDPDYQYRANSTCSTNDIPMTTSSFNPASLPALSYVVPNQCDDMHTLPGSGQACPAYFGSNSGTSVIGMGDSWLASVVPSLLAQPGVTVVITWDEGSINTTPWEHIVALAAGAGVTPGSTDATAYTHYSLEAALYNYFGLGAAPNNGATATPLPIPSQPPTITVDDSSPNITYDTWAGVTDPTSSGGTYRESPTKGATATFRFFGTGIKWVSRKGPSQGIASVTIDGVSKGNIDLYAASSQSFTQVYAGLASTKHTIVITVTGTKNAASGDTNVAVDAFIVGTATTQDTSHKVAYDSWTGGTSTSAIGGTFRVSAKAGATSSLIFTGTGVDWITATGPASGNATVTIDSVNKGTVDLYAASVHWKVVKSFTGLAPGNHTIVVTALGTKDAASTGTKVRVDAFVIHSSADVRGPGVSGTYPNSEIGFPQKGLGRFATGAGSAPAPVTYVRELKNAQVAQIT